MPASGPELTDPQHSMRLAGHAVQRDQQYAFTHNDGTEVPGGNTVYPPTMLTSAGAEPVICYCSFHVYVATTVMSRLADRAAAARHLLSINAKLKQLPEHGYSCLVGWGSFH